MSVFAPNLLAELTSAANKAFDQALLCGSMGMKTRPRTEVGFVAAVTLGAVQGIGTAWVPILARRGCSLEIHGVFCHAAPLIKYGTLTVAQNVCELADLLVVVDYKDSKGQVTREASLIQAKMASKAGRVSLKGVSSQKQLNLYSAWPTFEFCDRVYGQKSYSLVCTGGGHSGSFGVIDRHFKNSDVLPPKWTQHAAVPTPNCVTNEPTLGEFIAQMIGGSGGACGRIAVPCGSDDWSKVVDLLLKITYMKAFRHSSTLGSATLPRGTTAMCFLDRPRGAIHSRVRRIGGDWKPPFHGFATVEDDDPSGISTMKIEVSSVG